MTCPIRVLLAFGVLDQHIYTHRNFFHEKFVFESGMAFATGTVGVIDSPKAKEGCCVSGLT